MVMSMVNLFKVMTSLVNLFQSGDVTPPVELFLRGDVTCVPFKVVMKLVDLFQSSDMTGRPF
jgi:hypothetical protein